MTYGDKRHEDVDCTRSYHRELNGRLRHSGIPVYTRRVEEYLQAPEQKNRTH